MIAFVVGCMIIQDLARQFNSILISSVVYTLGAFFLCVHLLLSSTVDLSAQALLAPGLWPWLLMVFTGIVATAICNMFWNRAIAELGVARTSLYQYWIPVLDRKSTRLNSSH